MNPAVKVKMIDTGVVVEHEKSYALRLIEQGDAVLVGDGEPVTPDEPPVDPSQYGALIATLQERCTSLESAVEMMRQENMSNAVFANMYQSIAQAQERQLECLNGRLQEEIDAITGNEEG